MNATEIQTWLINHIAQMMDTDPQTIDIEESLENYGLDSAQAMTLISQLEKQIGYAPSPGLLWHYPNIKSLSQRLAEETPLTPIIDLAKEVTLEPTIDPKYACKMANSTPEHIFLTGGTGFLGAFLIKELLAKTNGFVHCLVRGGSEEEAFNKLQQNLTKYHVWEPSYSKRLMAIPGDLARPQLGLSNTEFEELSEKIDVIYHSAALLNYVYPYLALKPANVLGTAEILRLACQVKIKPVHYVSSVAVFESSAYAGQLVEEQDSFDHWEGIHLGYSQTKWVAEKLVKLAASRGLPVTIHRPPLIAGDSQTGVSNSHDFINIMVKGCLEMRCFPEIEYFLDMSPVDYVSKAIVYLSQQTNSLGKAFHLQHPNPIPLLDLVKWVQNLGYSVRLVSYSQWQEELNQHLSSPDHPLYRLRPFLLQRWSEEQLTIPDLYLQSRRPIISCQQTLQALANSSISCPSLDATLLTNYASYLLSTGFLTPA